MIGRCGRKAPSNDPESPQAHSTNTRGNQSLGTRQGISDSPTGHGLRSETAPQGLEAGSPTRLKRHTCSTREHRVVAHDCIGYRTGRDVERHVRLDTKAGVDLFHKAIVT